MNNLDRIKARMKANFDLVRVGNDKPEDIRQLCQDIFFWQLELDEYPTQDEIYLVVDVREELHEVLSGEFNKALTDTLDVRVLKGDANAMVLLGQYYYDRPKVEQFDTLGAKELADQNGAANGKDDLAVPRARKNVDKEHQEKARPLFAKAYESESILSMYYLCKLWCEGKDGNKNKEWQEIPAPSDVWNKFYKKWSDGDLSFKKCELKLMIVMIIRHAIQQAVLIEQNRELESVNNQLSTTICDNAHTMQHTIQPIIIDKVIQTLSPFTSRRAEVFSLYRACQAERKALELAKLMELKLLEPNKLQSAIQSSVCSNRSRQCIGVRYIIDYVFSRRLDEMLDVEDLNFPLLRDAVVKKTGKSADELRTLYGDAMDENYKTSHRSEFPAWHWFGETVCPIELRIQPVWDKIYIISGSTLETLLFKWFNELILNVFKYHAIGRSPLIIIELGEEFREESFLKVSVINYVDTGNHERGSKMGLELMKGELNRINDGIESLLIEHSKDKFTVHLLLKKSLLFGRSV